jgi:hypothetical protein
MQLNSNNPDREGKSITHQFGIDLSPIGHSLVPAPIWMPPLIGLSLESKLLCVGSKLLTPESNSLPIG